MSIYINYLHRCLKVCLLTICLSIISACQTSEPENSIISSPEYSPENIDFIRSFDSNLKQIIPIFRVPRAFGMDFISLEGIEHGLITAKKSKELFSVENERIVQQISIEIADREIAAKHDHSGLLDISFDPQYNNLDRKHIFLVATLHGKFGCVGHSVLRLRYDYQTREILDNPINNSHVIFDQDMNGLDNCKDKKSTLMYNDVQRNLQENGVASTAGRILFLGDGSMLLSIGYGHRSDNVRRIDRFAGKIIRMTRDGEPVCSIEGLDDNPFCNHGNEVSNIHLFTRTQKLSRSCYG